MKNRAFDPHKSFIDLAIVRSLIISTIIISASTAITIIVNTRGLEWNFSSLGFNECVTIFKVPLGILASAIPIIALLTANHRSEQSKEQMRLTQANNYITTYYKHVEEFQKYTKEHVNKMPVPYEICASVAHPRRLHKMIFPHAKSGLLTIDENLFEKLCLDLEKVILATAVFRAEVYENRTTKLHILNQKIDGLAKKYQVTNYRPQGIPQMIDTMIMMDDEDL